MKMYKKIIALTVMLFGMTGWAGDSAPFLLDTTDQLVATGGEVSFSYNSSWIGGDPSAEVVISADGTEINRTTGVGEFTWSPLTSGKHTLTYMTYIDGVAQEEVYTATVFKDWKYTVEDGKATIIETTQTSGDIVIPSEIDGLPVVGIGSDVFINADIESVTIPSGLLMMGMPGFIEAEFKSMTSFDDAISIVDNSRGVVLSADMLTADTITDHTMYGYAAKMFFEGGVEYGFLAYYDDKSSVKIDGVNVISASSVECRSQTCTVKYEESGWHDIELRGWNNGGEGAAYGSCEGIMWKKGSGAWQKFADPGDGSLFRVGATYSIKEMFPGCFGKIKRIELTGEVTEISDGLFAGCAALESFVIPDGVTKIGAEAFKDCISLVNVGMPDSIASIEDSAFSGCNLLENVMISGNVTNIGDKAFCNCNSLTSITIPSGVSRIGLGAFAGCSNIVNVSIGCFSGDSVIPGFYEAEFRSMDSFDDTLSIIDNSRGIVLSADMLTVDTTDEHTMYGYAAKMFFEGGMEYTFKAYYDDKSSVRIDGVTVISAASIECRSQTYSVRYAESGWHQIELRGWNNRGGGAAYDVCEGILWRKGSESWQKFIDPGDGSRFCVNGSVVKSIKDIFPDSYNRVKGVTLTGEVTEIPENTFAGCAALESFVIPDGVMKIGDNAFEGCSSLVSVVIPNGVKEISPTAFSRCISLASIDLPDTLINYNFDCIKGTGLEKYDANGLCIVDGWLLACNNKDISSLVVPNGVVGICRYALADMYNLKTVTLPQSLKYISEGAFKGDSYLDNLSIPSNVQTIGANAFEDCSYLQTLTVGGVKSVGDRAFAGCTQLSSAIFKNGLVDIGDCAFSNCWRMQSVSLPISVTNVESTAFTGCSSLTGVTSPSGIAPLSDWFAPIYSQIRDVTIPVGEKNICEKMFEGCSSLVNIEISEGITNISASAFRNCRSVETLFVPDSVLSIGDDAFRGCSKLKTFIMPEIMRSVGASAFRDCYNLEDISLSRNLTELPDYVFYGTSLDSVTVPATVTYLGSYIVSSATTDIYYMGNAPDYAEDVYDNASYSLTTWVTKDTLGWDGRPNSRDLPFKWLGHDIKFWTVNRFDVTFDANGGIFAPVSSDKYACEQTTYTWYALPPFEPTRLGYKFDGYWTEPEGGTRIYSTMNVKLTKAHTLYAHWDRGPVVKVRFNANGGTITPNEIEFTAGGTFGTLPVPTREHYVFEGWYTEASGGERMYPSSEVPSANRELFAHWSPCSYTIRFHANNGTDAIMEQSFTYGDTVTLRYNTFSFRGCEFAGWALAPGGKAVYADGKKLTDVSAVRDGIIHLYATWVGNTYSVRFDSHGGVGRMDNQTFAIGVAQSLMPCTFTRSGYRFVGWALSTTAGVSYRDREMVMNLSTIRNTTVTLYAVWEAVVTPNPGPTPTPNPQPTPTPNPQPTPAPEPEPLPMPELGEGDYEVGGEMSDTSIPENVASVYDGYVYSGNKVVGTIQAKVARPRYDIANVTAAIQIAGEKKVSVMGKLYVELGWLVEVAKGGRELYLEFGFDGMKGTFGAYEIDGVRNFFSSRDRDEKSAAEEILEPYLGGYSMISDGGILSVTIAKKGRVTVRGTYNDAKVSAKAQALIGEEMICIPVIYSKRSVNLAFTIWLPINGGNAEIIGLDDAVIGKAGTLKNGAQFIIDGDIGDYIETEDERTLELLPNGEIVTVSGSKWLVADGIKPAKVAYKKGEFTITEGRKGAGIANPSGLKLTYKSKDGSFKGSFTAYAIVKGKLKKHKATVEGILVNGVGYGTITIKRIGTWAVTIK